MMKTTFFLLLVLTVVHDPADAVPQMQNINARPPMYLQIPGWEKCTENKGLGSADFLCLPARKPKACASVSWQELWGIKEFCPCTVYGTVPFPKCLQLTCPYAFGYTIVNRRGVFSFNDIGSHEECAKKCRMYPGCHAWTWGNQHAPEPNLCLMVRAYDNIIPDDYSVSGLKNCDIGSAAPMAMATGPGANDLSCYSVDVNTQAREDEEVLKNIESAKACNKKCREKTTCKFWTWANKNTGQWALDCILMSGYGTTAKDNNIISGKRNCRGH